MLFLTVPYAEKDEAKALGARWNPTRRRWYVPDGVATEPFARWTGQGAAAGSPTAGPARSDGYTGKTVVGTNYLLLEHDCNPFEPCARCGEQLAGSAWLKVRQQLAVLVSSL
ncbi:DUF5710 domain-containing protein [Massilia oculi]|uniref:DUF5710 domain-containing protein n=1 Tax=Massilia hydrophila TaxID=3044279 RepID=A0ABS7YD07_9BURK|nr:DUF5710 domain-containing protein [Massilia oculi]MCA1856414.1 DUF5710 domain-containing protein [Massilia oculi]